MFYFYLVCLQGSTVGLICVYHSGADVNLETDVLFSVGNEILADGADFSRFSNGLILSTNFSGKFNYHKKEKKKDYLD